MTTDSLIGRAPVDRAAARILGKGIQYVPDKKIVQTHSETPLPIVPANAREVDLTGRTFGRFRVIGKSAKGAATKALWVVRCVCGRYCTRSSKAINNPANDADCCDECRQLLFLQHRDRKMT